MAAVHSSCRLCIFLATRIREREERKFMKRPCKCTRGTETVYHVYVRERGRFEMDSVFLRYFNIQWFHSNHEYLSLFSLIIKKDTNPYSMNMSEKTRVYFSQPSFSVVSDSTTRLMTIFDKYSPELPRQNNISDFYFLKSPMLLFDHLEWGRLFLCPRFLVHDALEKSHHLLLFHFLLSPSYHLLLSFAFSFHQAIV